MAFLIDAFTVHERRNIFNIKLVVILNIFGSEIPAPANKSVVISISFVALILISSLDSKFSYIAADIRRILRDMIMGSLLWWREVVLP